jgi:hypothetical protein
MFAAIRLPVARRFTALILRETINGSVNFMTNFPPMARVPGNCTLLRGYRSVDFET